MNNGIIFLPRPPPIHAAARKHFRPLNLSVKILVMKEVKLAASTSLVLLAQLLFNQVKIVCLWVRGG